MEKKALILFSILALFVTGLLMACGEDDQEDGKDIFIVVPTDTNETEKLPYITTNPSSLTFDGKEGVESAIILTNCKYMKVHKFKKPDWYDATIEISTDEESSIMRLVIKVKENNTGQERSSTMVLDGYNDKTDDAKALASCAVNITQF